ncbi:MAG: DUF58 domain-containing protein [bacterium]|nr:DUF58 domain-containing protein [bacterium]
MPVLTVFALVADALLLGAAWWDSRRAAALSLEAERTWPPLLTQGSKAIVELRISNPGQRTLTVQLRESLHAAIAASPEHRTVAIDAHTVCVWPLALDPRVRGLHEAGPLVARVLGPWGLSWSQRVLITPESVRVYPQIRWQGRAGRLLSMAHRHQLGAVPLHSRGVGGEPYALREYLPGDPLHLIHWKATARHGKPVTREQTQEAQGRLVVLLDCGRSMTSTNHGRSKLDHALAAALALARVASSRGDRTSIAALADRPLRTVRVRGGSLGLSIAYRRLYDLKAELVEPAYDLVPEIVSALEPRRATVVVLTSVVDLAAAELLTTSMLAIGLRHRPLLVNLEDPELVDLALDSPADADHVFAKVAAMEILLENGRITRQLRRRGVRSVTAPADKLALTTMDAYLEIAAARR